MIGDVQSKQTALLHMGDVNIVLVGMKYKVGAGNRGVWDHNGAVYNLGRCQRFGKGGVNYVKVYVAVQGLSKVYCKNIFLIIVIPLPLYIYKLQFVSLPLTTCQMSNSWWISGYSSRIIFRIDGDRSVVTTSTSRPCSRR